jgi:coenzyme F420 biosynthesis associated uncharacterized protein
MYAKNSPAGEAAEVIDWELAVSTARRLARPGPDVTVAEARQVVTELRAFAAEATDPVRDYTGLDGGGNAKAPVVIVDRGGWAQANTDGMRELITPLTDKLRGNRKPGKLDQIGPKVTGIETGALLAFLSTKVLGQFDPFWSGGDGSHGRLLLVAPNVVQVERELKVEPRDFRLWVCLHEETHRVQFTAVPWLRDHIRNQVAEFVDATELEPGALLSRLREIARALLPGGSGGSSGSGGARARTLVDIVSSPEQKAVIDRVTATMSLLEGHADVVMDGVGPDVVPSVDEIRAKFQRRRKGAGGLDRTGRKLLGLDAKMRQYRDGARFVHGVIDDVGMAGFNRVWESPDMLPTLDEIGDPVAWVRRVHSHAEPSE